MNTITVLWRAIFLAAIAALPVPSGAQEPRQEDYTNWPATAPAYRAYLCGESPTAPVDYAEQLNKAIALRMKSQPRPMSEREVFEIIVRASCAPQK